MPVMQDVYSSHVNRMGYDPETKEMTVEWDSGKTSVYDGVPEKVFSDVSTSYSIGKAMNAMVKGKYSHRYAG